MFQRISSSSASYKGPLTRSKKNIQEEFPHWLDYQLVQDSLFLQIPEVIIP